MHTFNINISSEVKLYKIQVARKCPPKPIYTYPKAYKLANKYISMMEEQLSAAVIGSTFNN